MVSIVLAPQCILQYKLINIFSIKCYFRANLKIDVTKNIIFRGISWVKLKSEIHSPGNFLQAVGNRVKIVSSFEILPMHFVLALRRRVLLQGRVLELIFFSKEGSNIMNFDSKRKISIELN